eukprot:CAMPEP_0185203508 /NCGR_PEP_ID=MMETSP1140-20130426/53116_1 /TAXON_ID=298111 /ORGANISM="Pavlova sp., Strain CCMP459" /LENGTH=102 /DNA_ID=CAMNT_0027771009 /DNA_START=33 /DNA_END=341 /DNA_ORIENTATION=+
MLRNAQYVVIGPKLSHSTQGVEGQPSEAALQARFACVTAGPSLPFKAAVGVALVAAGFLVTLCLRGTGETLVQVIARSRARSRLDISRRRQREDLHPHPQRQ